MDLPPRRPHTFLLALLTMTSLLQANDFHESFSGHGDYRSLDGRIVGLDNPGWEFSWTSDSHAPSVTGKGLQFDLEPESPLLPLSILVARTTHVTGSFTEQLEFSDLSLGDVQGTAEENPAIAGLGFRHKLASDDASRIGVSINERGGLEANQWELLFGPPFRRGEPIASIQAGTHIRLGIEYDEDERIARVFYDHDTKDASGPVYFEAQLSDDVQLTSPTRTIGQMFADEEVHSSGWLSSWELIPWSILKFGDYDASGALDLGDIERLYAGIRGNIRDRRLDVNLDGMITSLDVVSWIHDVKHTFVGDGNLDGEFNSTDLTGVFQSGQYETRKPGATWATGDWNGDGRFLTSDLVAAFQDGGYEAGPRPVAVPEPVSPIYLLLSFIGFTAPQRRHDANHE